MLFEFNKKLRFFLLDLDCHIRYNNNNNEYK